MKVVNNLRDKLILILFSSRKKKDLYKFQGCRTGKDVQESHDENILLWIINFVLENGTYRRQILCFLAALNLLHIPFMLGEFLSLNLYPQSRNPQLTSPAFSHVRVACSAIQIHPWDLDSKVDNMRKQSPLSNKGLTEMSSLQWEKRQNFKHQEPRIQRCTLVTVFLGGSSGASMDCFREIICQCCSLQCLQTWLSSPDIQYDLKMTLFCVLTTYNRLCHLK